MRLKIKVNINRLTSADNMTETAKLINKFLGINNKWHDSPNKEYSVSMIMGGIKDGEYIKYNNDAHIFVSTENNEIINTLLENVDTEFEILNSTIYQGYNILSGFNVRYCSKGKYEYITANNKVDFENYIKNKHNIDIEVLKFNNKPVKFKNGTIPSTNILFRTNEKKDKVTKLLNTGIGSSTGIGMGYVTEYKKK